MNVLYLHSDKKQAFFFFLFRQSIRGRINNLSCHCRGDSKVDTKHRNVIYLTEEKKQQLFLATLI